MNTEEPESDCLAFLFQKKGDGAAKEKDFAAPPIKGKEISAGPIDTPRGEGFPPTRVTQTWDLLMSELAFNSYIASTPFL